MTIAPPTPLPAQSAFFIALAVSSALKFVKPAAILAVIVYVQIQFPQLWPALGLDKIEQFGKRVASKRTLYVVSVGLALLVIRAAVIPVSGIPLPNYHDEYSYLLAGDTFAHGRLTNPPHPMWIHFETFHEIWYPTHMSMYPPGEGLVLAVGEILGCAWIGQLLCAVLMCAAICWMLYGWLPPRWALLGGVLTIPRLGLLSYWTNGYWSACLPALGGALALGALPRVKRHLHPRDAAIMAIGLFLLANTRPYEGLLLSVGIAVALLVWMFGKKHPPLSLSFSKFVLPLVLALVPVSIWTGYYYYRVTGSPFRLTYNINRDMYAMGRYFIWQPPWPQKTYHHAKMQAQYERELREATENQTLSGFFHRARGKIYYFYQVYLIPPLPFVLIALPCAVRDRRMRVPWLIAMIFIAGLSVEVWFMPHYAAPATALLFLILLQCMRHLRFFRWRGAPVGLAFVRGVCLIYVVTVVLRVGLAVGHVHAEREWQHGDMQRAAIAKELQSLPGQHVVLVSYSADFDLDRDWVYNGAAIDSQKIIWARDMGTERNRELIAYYPGRHFWSVHAGMSPAPILLQPYSASPGNPESPVLDIVPLTGPAKCEYSSIGF
ncbi:MAG TPA: hypothetical protein VND65_20590 [Candidatus Binatia bacterium]|nr:hypothetical protein [Candidatus Binatia bacterium]